MGLAASPKNQRLMFSLYIIKKSIMNIYVGNLDFKTKESELEVIFTEFGAVSTAKIINDPRFQVVLYFPDDKTILCFYLE